MRDKIIGILGPIELAEFRNYLPVGAIASDAPKGLGGTPVNSLCVSLLQRGYQITVFSLDPSVTDEVIYQGDRLRICIGPFTSKRARNFFRVERRYLRNAIAREKPDLLHAHWTYEYALSAIDSKVPLVITAHDAPVQILLRNFIPYRIARTFMAYMAMWRAKKVVAVSPYVSRHLRMFGFHKKSVDIIPNGIDMSLLKMGGQRDTDHHINFASILSGWGGLKNSEVAIKAFAKLRRRIPEARLYLIGPEHGDSEVGAEWSRRNKLEEGIIFYGRRPHQDVIKMLAQKIDILVHPSLEESFGLTLIEASALGIPAIGGKNSGAVPWVLGDGKYGVLTDVTSVNALADAMYRLATDMKFRTELGQRARQSVVDRFTMDVVTDRYLNIYESLAQHDA